MPVVYKENIVTSHLHCRSHAGLFDVSHMLQIELHGKDAIDFVESITVADVRNLFPGNMCLSVMLTDQGTIIDDTMVTRQEDHVAMVLNAGCAEKDLAHLGNQLSAWHAAGKDVEMRNLSEKHSLIALQGPKAAEVLAQSIDGGNGAEILRKTPFLATFKCSIFGRPVAIGRCGYTGEDGFEIQVLHEDVVHVADHLVADQTIVRPTGLGARDTLRLEAGLCLYGNDIDTTVTPVEASLAWTIPKSRREESFPVKFPGYDIIMTQLSDKKATSQRRVGLSIKERRPIPHPAQVLNSEGAVIGRVTSGTMGPSLGFGIGMGYLDKPYNLGKQTGLHVEVRGKKLEIAVTRMPFVPASYYKV